MRAISLPVIFFLGLIVVLPFITSSSRVYSVTYTSLETDALTVQKTGLAGLDWFVHNKLLLTSKSITLTPVPVYGFQQDWMISNGLKYSYYGVAQLPNLLQAYIPNNEYLWVDPTGDVKAHSDIGWGIDMVYGQHLVASLNIDKLTTADLTVKMAGKNGWVVVGYLPASTSSSQLGTLIYGWGATNPSLRNLIPVDFAYAGGWTTPTDQTTLPTTKGVLDNAASKFSIIENQVIAWSSVPGNYTLSLRLFYGNTKTRIYLAQAILPASCRCPTCPILGDTHGAIKLTDNGSGNVTYFVTRLTFFSWNVTYNGVTVANLENNNPNTAATSSVVVP